MSSGRGFCFDVIAVPNGMQLLVSLMAGSLLTSSSGANRCKSSDRSPLSRQRGFYGFFLKRKPEGMLNAGSYFLAAFFAGAFLAAGAASGAGVAAGFGVAPVMSTSSTVKIRAE